MLHMIAVACPEWRGLKVEGLLACAVVGFYCSGLPRMEGTERGGVIWPQDCCDDIAVACPEWRGLKVDTLTMFIAPSSYCSGLPRMEGTESSCTCGVGLS